MKPQTKSNTRLRKTRVAALINALAEHGIFLREIIICNADTTPRKTCVLHYNEPPKGEPDPPINDPKSYTCYSYDDVKCKDGTECKPQKWEDAQKNTHISCCAKDQSP